MLKQRPDIDDCAKVFVHVIYKGSIKEEGTGFVLSDGSRYYVITTYHIFHNEVIDLSNLDMILHLEDQEVYVSPISILNQDEPNDFVIIEVKRPNSDFDYANQVKICAMPINNKFAYLTYGFTDFAKGGRIYPVSCTGFKRWHFTENVCDNLNEDAHKIVAGLSGAGIFFYLFECFYFVEYVVELSDQQGIYNDCYTRTYDIALSYLPSCVVEKNIIPLILEQISIMHHTIDNELRESFVRDKVEMANNLQRKLDFLYPKDDKFITYLDSYLKGLDVVNRISNVPTLKKEIDKQSEMCYEEFYKRHSMWFTPCEARDELKDLEKSLQNAISESLTQKDLVNCWAAHSVAEKLLICSIDYKNISTDEENIQK